MTATFTKKDIRFLAAAAAKGMTHDHQNAYETGLDVETDGTRAGRGLALVMHLYEDEQCRDQNVLDLLDYLYMESPQAPWNQGSEEYELLAKNVLRPRGVHETEDGFVIDAAEKSAARATPAPRVETAVQGRSTKEELTRNASAPPAAPKEGGAEAARSTSATAPSAGPNSVFVVHGRDVATLGELRRFLNFLHVRTMSWAEAGDLVDNPQPTTYDIVSAGIRGAAAVIVLFTPDDEARLRPDLRGSGEDEERPTGQARQNVTLEAGMAFAMQPNKTIFVKAGRTRDISDIAGFNWVSMNGSFDSRKMLANRLRGAGVQISEPANLLDQDAGSFAFVRPKPSKMYR